jgi:hypothetical protein
MLKTHHEATKAQSFQGFGQVAFVTLCLCLHWHQARVVNALDFSLGKSTNSKGT